MKSNLEYGNNNWEGYNVIYIPKDADEYRNGKHYKTLTDGLNIPLDEKDHSFHSSNIVDYYHKGRMARFYADDNFIIQSNTDIGYAILEEQTDGKDITSIYTNKVTK